MQLLQALIAAVYKHLKHLKALMWLKSAPLIERKVVHRAAPVMGAKNLPGAPVD